MNVVESLRLFCDNQTSMRQARDYLAVAGVTREEFAEALGQIIADPRAKVRFSKYQKDEYMAEMYISFGA